MKKIALALFFLGIASATNAQGLIFPGGRGLMHLHTAWTLDKGALTLHGYTSSYYKTVLVGTATQGTQSITFWDVQGAIALHYGAGRHFELGLTQMVYQDTHHGGKGYDTPSDINFKVKFGSIGKIQSRFRLGLLVEGRIPLGKHFNIPFEPYTSGRFEAGIIGLISYASDLLIPESGFNLHLNLGFWHHNDVGRFLTGNPNDNVAVLSPSREFVWGLGFVLPASQFDFGLEVFGRNYIVRPPVTAYSREDFIYVTPSIMFRLSNRVSFSAGLDLRLSSNDDKTLYSSNGTLLPRINPDLPSYPGWRIRVANKIYLTKREPREIEKPLFTENRDSVIDSTSPDHLTLQEQLVKERRKTEVAEEELQKIREDRKKMAEMLARLRQILQYGKPLEKEEVTKKGAVEGKEKVTKKNN
ncbi:MAG: hypothetical protein D6814_00095 [Calditrichaeota bacterium]|nr:MAG: hypothetical protein D6814_00095 [Calditrichota bacterium]